jgi:hypothetical protein
MFVKRLILLVIPKVYKVYVIIYTMQIYSQDSNIIGILLDNKNDNDLILNLRQIRYGLREVRKLYPQLLEENRFWEVHDELDILLENKAVDWIAYTIYDSRENIVLQEWRYEFQNNPYYSIEISSDILQTDIPFKFVPNVPSNANFICHISWASCLSQEQKNSIINKIRPLNLASIEKSAYPNSIFLYTQTYFQSSYSIGQNNNPDFVKRVNPNTPSPKISVKHTALLDVELKYGVKKYTASSSNHKSEIGDVKNINQRDIQSLFEEFQANTKRFIQTDSSLTSNDENYQSILIALKTIGCKFYKLFPPEFHSYFSDFDEGTIILMKRIEELEWIPWEIIYDADQELFWGQKFIITRLREQVKSKKEKISNRIEFFNGQLHFLSNSISKNEECIERAKNMINNIVSNYDCITNSSRVEFANKLEKLSESTIIHFTCHCSMDGKNRPTLFLDDYSNNPGDSLDIEMIQTLRLNKIPFIFANACMTETYYQDCWSESVNFGFTFLNKGVQAFIGTMGILPVKPALEFAETFYKNLRTLSVGEALWETKKIFSTKNNPFWLFYCLYGDATLYLREQQLDETQVSSSSM